ncbi:ParA family protein [Citrobacter freundii]|uniref:ParA family protein n=1 Tax=Citrobacter freundii TaxID=546 RepID=UPI000F9895B8|nr:ParA family protein [Citrobacter freundii]EAA7190321.1 ParA family protein [Salmonella enterica subsp. enterica serovar Napoli]EBX4551583.1 ParA family protein [Salmonella enterica subsp. enterica serovar Saintpaul]ECJ2834557.1 ParA family protein [Salmonella enterica]EGN2315787.1 ParA family protein [Escherichia coli]EHP9414869.1 ParA family protein [Salmonella enterica subsp. enterica serovar Infantis]EHS5250936.1 ParA family protein [Salmonella enterica subsp. enterica serovar Typhimuri
MAWIVGFISQKGGIGKSTKARALAREATSSGIKTKLADLDLEQATSSDWHRRRLAAGLPPAASVELFGTAKQAIESAGDVDLLILDGPARASKGTLEIAKVADLVVQPTGASLDDLIPAIKVFNALVKDGIPRSKLVFSLSRVGTEAEEAEARAYISEAGYETLAGCLYEFPAYRQAMNAGLAVTETRYKRLKQNADEVIQSLIDKIGE